MLILTTRSICVAPSPAGILINLHALVFSQPPGGIPGSQPLLPNSLDPTRPQGTAETAVVLIALLKYLIMKYVNFV